MTKTEINQLKTTIRAMLRQALMTDDDKDLYNVTVKVDELRSKLN